MSVFWADLRFSFRILSRTPGFTTAAVLLLALAIGANTAMYSIVDALVLLPLPFHDPQRLVAVWESDLKGLKWPKMFTSYRDFDRWRHGSRSFVALAAYSWWPYTIGGQGQSYKAPGVVVTPEFFPMLGV